MSCEERRNFRRQRKKIECVLIFIVVSEVQKYTIYHMLYPSEFITLEL